MPEEQSITLPWSFDISYRLNGKPATGESLAGASGLIDIEVAVTANPRASSYLKNNFMLILGTMSNTEDNYSFSVPGAQLQSLGSYQVAFYPILPLGEETVNFSFGSDSFESPGIFMMMVVGGGVMPLIQDFIAKYEGYMASYWLVVAMLCYILYYALKGCKNVNTDIPVE